MVWVTQPYAVEHEGLVLGTTVSSIRTHEKLFSWEQTRVQNTNRRDWASSQGNSCSRPAHSVHQLGTCLRLLSFWNSSIKAYSTTSISRLIHSKSSNFYQHDYPRRKKGMPCLELSKKPTPMIYHFVFNSVYLSLSHLSLIVLGTVL